MYCAPMACRCRRRMPFGALMAEIIPSLYPIHPDTAKIDWPKAEWFSSGKPFTPDSGEVAGRAWSGSQGVAPVPHARPDRYQGTCS